MGVVPRLGIFRPIPGTHLEKHPVEMRVRHLSVHFLIFTGTYFGIHSWIKDLDMARDFEAR